MKSTISDPPGYMLSPTSISEPPDILHMKYSSGPAPSLSTHLGDQYSIWGIKALSPSTRWVCEVKTTTLALLPTWEIVLIVSHFVMISLARLRVIIRKIPMKLYCNYRSYHNDVGKDVMH